MKRNDMKQKASTTTSPRNDFVVCCLWWIKFQAHTWHDYIHTQQLKCRSVAWVNLYFTSSFSLSASLDASLYTLSRSPWVWCREWVTNKMKTKIKYKTKFTHRFYDDTNIFNVFECIFKCSMLVIFLFNQQTTKWTNIYQRYAVPCVYWV